MRLSGPNVSAFSMLVSDAKTAAFPVFTLKFCHFLARGSSRWSIILPMGNLFPTYEACFTTFRAEWLSTDEVARQALVFRLAELIDAPLADGYPIKNKIVEICLIGRKQG